MKKTTRILSIMLAALLMMTAIPFAVMAETSDTAEETGKTLADAKEGDLLLEADTLFAPADTTTWSSDFGDLKVSAGSTQNVSTSGITETLTKLGTTHAGIKTNLPLNENTKYTIELFVLPLVDLTVNGASFSVCFEDVGHNNKAQGVSFKLAEINSIYGYTTGSQATQFDNVWMKAQTSEQYTKIVLVIDGMNALAFVDGKEAGTVTFGSYPVGFLGVSIKTSKHVSTYVGKEILRVKDVKVWCGNTTVDLPEETVNFVKDGETIDNAYSTVTWGKTIPSFPTIEVAEDEVAVWFYKDTNVVVTASDKVLRDVTLEAKVFKKSASSVAAMQLTKPTANNTQSVRFISALQSLQGSETGFEITVKYMEDGAVIKGKPTVQKTTHVYSSITATTDGTVTSVSANNLGGNYLCALSVDGVPTDAGRIDFIVTPYVVFNGETVYGETVTFKLNNGAADNTLDALN